MNNLKQMREEMMLSKAELARRAEISVLTVDRIEKGYTCRHSTKRKILVALGIDLKDRSMVWPPKRGKCRTCDDPIPQDNLVEGKLDSDIHEIRDDGFCSCFCFNLKLGYSNERN